VFGNVLAVLLGLTDKRAGKRTLDALTKARVGDPYPGGCDASDQATELDVAAVYGASSAESCWQYHNGWDLADGGGLLGWPRWLLMGGVSRLGRDLVGIAAVVCCSVWAFTEWLHGKTLAPRWMPGQS